MSNLIPSLGAKGIYKVSEPFTTLVKNIAYTCIATRRLSDFVSIGRDPKALYYDPYGLGDAIWARDSKDRDVCIVSLQSDSGQIVYVPSSFILSFPSLNGIPYTVRILGINLGAIPDSLDLNSLYGYMHDLVRDTLGVESEVKSVAISETKLMSKEQHDSLELARLDLINTTQTERSRIIELERLVTTLQEQNSALEQYIIDNQ